MVTATQRTNERMSKKDDSTARSGAKAISGGVRPSYYDVGPSSRTVPMVPHTLPPANDGHQAAPGLLARSRR